MSIDSRSRVFLFFSSVNIYYYTNQTRANTFRNTRLKVHVSEAIVANLRRLLVELKEQFLNYFEVRPLNFIAVCFKHYFIMTMFFWLRFFAAISCWNCIGSAPAALYRNQIAVKLQCATKISSSLAYGGCARGTNGGQNCTVLTSSNFIVD